MVATGDTLLVAGVGTTVNTGVLTLAPWSGSSVGARIGGSSNIFGIYSNATTFYSNAVSPAAAMTLVNGNVGIGNNNPRDILQVQSGSPTTRLTGTTNFTTSAFIFDNRLGNFWHLNGYGNNPTTGARGAAYAAGQIICGSETNNNYENAYMAFQVCFDPQSDGTGGLGVTTERMRIKSNGNVGINNNNPDRALNVTGAVYASSMISGGGGYNYPYGDATSGLSVYGVTYSGSIRHTYSSPRGSDTIWFYTAGNSTYNNQLQSQLTGSNGNFYTRGTFTGGGADYAELFEWTDGNPDGEDRVGYPVILVEDKIAIATENSTDIIGIVSHTPTVVGDSSPLHWQGKYLKDDFGRPVYEEQERVVWDEGRENHLVSEPGLVIPPDATYFTDTVQVINPLYDENIPFVPREDRKEWGMVGLMGKIYMRKSQPSHPNWKCMKRTENTDLWFVR
jgi:hypothetical protein